MTGRTGSPVKRIIMGVVGRQARKKTKINSEGLVYNLKKVSGKSGRKVNGMTTVLVVPARGKFPGATDI